MFEKNPRDFRTKAIVLRRTNFREADRILNLLTPEGKVSAIARGVRKERSKLAGGIELFCLTEVNLHRGKGEILTLTGAKMLAYYKNITTDLARLELASEVLKSVGRITDQVEDKAFFSLVCQVFSGLDAGFDLRLIRTWFLFNFAKIQGETVNFFRDISGEKLREDEHYFWDPVEGALRQDEQGNISTLEIKIGRLMLCSDLSVLIRVKNVSTVLDSLLGIAQTF